MDILPYKIIIKRKEDGYQIKSNNVDFTEIGIWVNDELDTGNEGLRLFIPWHNVLQIVEYMDEQ